jgi:hypothetical protein
MLNCEKCGATYTPYQIGKEPDQISGWLSVSSKDKKTEGSCPFCNPDSKFYNYKWILKNP